MTAKLPPLQWPLQIVIIGFSEPELDAIRKWADDRALQAVRDALEPLIDGRDFVPAYRIRALLKEYSDD